MKKIFIIVSIFILALTAGCGKKENSELPKETESKTIATEIAEQTAGEEKELPEAEILDETLATEIKDINKEAVITNSTNPGAKLITIKLPTEKGEKTAKNFVSQALKLMEIEKLNNSEYDYICIIATSGDKNLITATYNKTEEGFKLDKLTAVDKSLEESLTAESKKITK